MESHNWSPSTNLQQELKKKKQKKTKKTKKKKTLKMTKIECFFRKIVFRGDFNFPQFLGSENQRKKQI